MSQTLAGHRQMNLAHELPEPEGDFIAGDWQMIN